MLRHVVPGNWPGDAHVPTLTTIGVSLMLRGFLQRAALGVPPGNLQLSRGRTGRLTWCRQLGRQGGRAGIPRHLRLQAGPWPHACPWAGQRPRLAVRRAAAGQHAC